MARKYSLQLAYYIPRRCPNMHIPDDSYPINVSFYIEKLIANYITHFIIGI